MIEIERGPGAGRLPSVAGSGSDREVLFQLGGEGACDDEASVARKMITGNQSLAVAVLLISIS